MTFEELQEEMRELVLSGMIECTLDPESGQLMYTTTEYGNHLLESNLGEYYND